MTLTITPGEFNIFNDRYVIKTKCPQDKITDDMLISRVRNANLSAGDGVTVQCFDHKFETLLFEAEYRVYQRIDSLRTHDVTDRETRQINDVAYRLARRGEWWASPAGKVTIVRDEALALMGETILTADARVADPPLAVVPVWNVGKNGWDVTLPNGETRFFAKEDGGKEAALAFLANPTAKAA